MMKCARDAAVSSLHAVNRLKDETSPYLLQHAENPVDWYPWGDEAFARAREEGKPIFLSIGYAACHWCHVMERESFSVPETAELMNESFVCIKVDREERPDVDSLYMDVGGRDQRQRRLAAQRAPPRRRQAVLGRDLPAAGAAAQPPELPRRPDDGRRRLARQARGARGVVGVAHRSHPQAHRDEAGRRARRRGADRAGDREHHLLVRLGVGRLGARTEVPRGERARVPVPAEGAADDREDARRDGGRRHVRPRRAVASTATRSTSAGSCRTSRRCSTTTRCSPSATSTATRRHATSGTAGSSSRRSATCCGSSRSKAAGSPPRRTPTPTARRGSASPGRAPRPTSPTRCSTRSRAAASSSAASSTRPSAPSSSSCASSGRSRLSTTRRSPPGTGSGWLRSPSAGACSSSAEWVDAASALGEFLLGPLSTRRRPPPPHLARRRREGHGVPRGLRERRERAARAARGDRRAALAPRGEPPRPARGRPLLRRGGRRLLPDAERRRDARHPQEGLRRPPGAERELDDGVGAAAAVADLRRRRARGEGGLGVQARARRAAERAVVVRLGARRGRLLSREAARGRDRRPARRAGRAPRADALGPARGDRSRAGRRHPAARREGRSSTGRPPSTSASASPARRRPPIRATCSRSRTSRVVGAAAAPVPPGRVRCQVMETKVSQPAVRHRSAP